MLKDKLGNTLTIGDIVVFCTKERNSELRVAVIRRVSGHFVFVKSLHGRTISRSSQDVVKYFIEWNDQDHSL